MCASRCSSRVTLFCSLQAFWKDHHVLHVLEMLVHPEARPRLMLVHRKMLGFWKDLFASSPSEKAKHHPQHQDIVSRRTNHLHH